MARKRYLSTAISIDSRVRQLAERNEFAALLYTWMIPHATDDATISADPEELLMQVVPGFRWRTADDVQIAIEQMVEIGLLVRGDDRLRFPEQSFYRYQSYIGGSRRPTEEPPDPIEEERKSAQNAAEPRNAPSPAQNRASFKSSSSLRSSGDTPHSPPVGGRSRVKSKPERIPITDEDIEGLVAKHADEFGSGPAVREEIDAALNNVARYKAVNERIYVDRWLHRSIEYRNERGGQKPVALVRGSPSASGEVQDNTGKGIWR